MMDLDSIVQSSLAAWDVPGAAVAVVQPGNTRVAGYGVADFRTGQPVTAETIFSVASCTKAFATTAAALLVADQRLRWDDLVRRHLPEFRLADPFADAEVTVRDLACHRTGLGQHDLLWRLAPWDFSETIRRLQYVELDAPFRSKYLYSNLLYIVLGCVITAAGGMTWDDLVRKRLFEPLGMTRSLFAMADAETLSEVSTGHRRRDGLIEEYPEEAESRLIRASGSIRTCARDLGAWLRFQLSGGRTDTGEPLLPESLLRETHTPQMLHAPLPELVQYAGTSFAGYGLGWHVQDYRGQPLVEHTGGLAGFRAFVGFLPRQQCGVAVVANLRRCPMPLACGRTILDHLLAGPVTDWDSVYRSQARSHAGIPVRSAGGCPPCGDLTCFIGAYEEPAYGRLIVEQMASTTLALRWSTFSVQLRPESPDGFTAIEPDSRHENPLHRESVVFQRATSGEVGFVEFLGRRFQRCAP